MATILNVPVSSLHHHPKVLSLEKRFMAPNSRCSTVLLRQKEKTQRLCPILCSIHAPVQEVDKNMDFKITIDRSELVFPMERTQTRTCFLSNIDHQVNFMTHTLQFFDMHPDFTFETIVAKFEMAYRKVLVPYDFMAGRLKWNTELGRFEIDCNSAGAGFVVASSDRRLEELGNLVCPKLGYQQLTPRKMRTQHSGDQPLVIIQLTKFNCGGFSIGYSVHHMALDGISGIHFGQNIASILTNNHLMLPPYNVRHLLASRSPAKVNFPHPEFISMDTIQREKDTIPLKATFKKLDCKVLNLSANHINELAEVYSECNTHHPSSFSLIAAHIWRCVALARNSGNEPQKTSTLLYAMNIRPRVRPRLPTSYAGNAILNAYCTTTCHELEERPISHITQMISQAAQRMTDEYIRSTIDYMGVQKVPYGDVQLTSWLQHGENKPNFPWGEPKWNTPVLPTYGNNAIILIPCINGNVNGGINVLLSLPHRDMDKFQHLFYNIKGWNRNSKTRLF